MIHNDNAFLRNADKYKYIAHRLGFLMTGYPENSMDNIDTIFNTPELLSGIDGVEFDIQFTADHVPVILHDFKLADVSEEDLSIRKVPYDKVANLICGYRKSTYNSNIPWNQNNNFKLETLETFFQILMDNYNKLGDLIIKIETKHFLTSKEDLEVFKRFLYKYRVLNDNIIHISFFPWNLRTLRNLQQLGDFPLTRTEYLTDFKIQKIIPLLYSSHIDGISLGIKNQRQHGNIEISESAEKAAWLNALFYERRNSLTEEYLKKIIDKYGYAGIYTINDAKDISELLSRVSDQFLDEYAKDLVITSDNPIYLKNKNS